jgi:hypothetical protein
MRSLIVVFLLLIITTSPALGRSVLVQHELPPNQVSYAVHVLNRSLSEAQYDLSKSPGSSDLVIEVVEDTAFGPEGFSIVPGKNHLDIRGGGKRGLIYSALAVSEHLANGSTIESLAPERESAALRFRAIKHNLPWDSCRSGSALDLHYETVRDLNYWRTLYSARFSAGLGQGGFTDKATEELTRESIEQLGGEFDGPIWMEIKFNRMPITIMSAAMSSHKTEETPAMNTGIRATIRALGLGLLSFSTVSSAANPWMDTSLTAETQAE